VAARALRDGCRVVSWNEMVKEGYYFGLPLLVIAGAGYLLRWPVTGSVALFLAFFVCYFFRDPERIIPADEAAVVAPADGRVVVVKDEEFAGRPGQRVSIFLAIWNVHVNRAPAAGLISRMDYRPGRFLAAMRERASLENEQNVFLLDTSAGQLMFKQIAGLIARRVVAWKRPGDTVARGERIGLVRFGSRVDVWLPKEAEILVRVGQNVKGGSSVLARWAPRVSRPERELAIADRASGHG
jgi:phosphatidylserine decarboxylase